MHRGCGKIECRDEDLNKVLEAAVETDGDIPTMAELLGKPKVWVVSACSRLDLDEIFEKMKLNRDGVSCV